MFTEFIVDFFRLDAHMAIHTGFEHPVTTEASSYGGQMASRRNAQTFSYYFCVSSHISMKSRGWCLEIDWDRQCHGIRRVKHYYSF